MSEVDIRTIANKWVSLFEGALTAKDEAELAALLCDPAYFRDNGALTWDYRQFSGRDAVISNLIGYAGEVRARNFRISEKWPAPHLMQNGADGLIEAFFEFDTQHASCVLLVNAVPVDGEMKARAIFTRIEDLNAIARPAPHPRGRGYTPNDAGETWAQHREAARAYTNSDPEVLVVGAGQAGVVTSAYLRRFGVDVLNIDRHGKVGDSWNTRYAALSLHNPIEMNGFPFLSFPPHYPEYMSKDAVGEWLDLYARYMDLNVWTGTEFVSASYDDDAQRWDAVIERSDGEKRTLHPRHIVLATGGIGGKPAVPDLPGLSSFSGKVMHSSQYTKCADYGIRNAVIVGVATSAHDIAADLYKGGVNVTMLQRSPVVVNNVETANLAYAGYMDPAIPAELTDLRYGIGLINSLREVASQNYHAMAKDIDSELLNRLTAAGLRLGDGVNGQGWLDLFLRTGGGYYLNTGTSELIADGEIKVEQFNRVAQFVPNGVNLTDGSVIEADIVVLATGYESRKAEVVGGFGEAVAERVGEIARLDDEGEWANMWGQTAQRGLWFNGGGINQMRPGSQRLALLIKADLDGLIPEDRRRQPRSSTLKSGMPEVETA
jgi:putative flavoprotein involved in K+ transport